MLKELAYGHATLTTQGQSIHRAPGVWEEDEEVLTEEDMEDIQKAFSRAMMSHALKGVDIERLFTRKRFSSQRTDLEKPRAELNKQEQILSETVYDAKVIDGNLWVATNDGIAISSDSENLEDWLVYRFWNNSNQFSAYPNPFFINSFNVIDNQGHMRFVSNSDNSQAVVDIFDFSMDFFDSVFSV